MRHFHKLGLFVLCYAFGMGTPVGKACTDFILPVDSDNPTVISGRTFDFSPSFSNTVIVKVSEGQSFSADAPGTGGGKNGLQWENQYGYVGMAILPNSVNPDTTPLPAAALPVTDGLNTAGLSVASLWLDFAAFQNVSGSDDCPSCVDVQKLTGCLLGTCATVGDVVKKLSEIRVWVQAELANSSLVHYSIHDPNGKSLVVEFINGELKIYENDDLGVLANDPTFEWQLTNYYFLYRGLSSQDNPRGQYLQFTKDSSGVIHPIEASWESEVLGSGLFGLPGDSMSPSRFVRAAALRSLYPTKYDGRQGVQYAMQLLGRVSVCDPEVVLVGGADTNPTLWTVVRDHTQKILYYSSRMDHSLKAIKLNDLNFSAASPSTYTLLSQEPWFLDTTSALQPHSPVREYSTLEFSTPR